MAIIARFSMDILADKRFELYQHFKKSGEVMSSLGFPKPQALVAAFGTPESRLEMNYRFETLEAFTAVWNRMQEHPARMWRRSLAPFMVPGSARWDVYRVKSDEEDG